MEAMNMNVQPAPAVVLVDGEATELRNLRN
jgi:hypothetical protein